MKAIVIGAGLAGCEAAWQLAQNGIEVTLYEMKPERFSPAHHNKNFCELVCSNSLRAAGLSNAVGLLKEEMRILSSLVISCADKTCIPAGGALAVDREKFSALVTKNIEEHPNIKIVRTHIDKIPDSPCIVATGPLSSDEIAADIVRLTGHDGLYFYDAAAPIVTYESIDMSNAYLASRYDRGTPDYINCPMNKEEYTSFYEALITAEEAPIKEFEKLKVFEGCMPIEVMAKRGFETLLFGPLKPVGLIDPKTGKAPFAAVQLRRDNSEGTLYNLVGFQTHLKFGEQKRVFSLIPALHDGEFVRYGVMHRNTFMDSPRLLTNHFSLRNRENLYFAGQMTGVEGYVESAASGMAAGISLSRKLMGKPQIPFPKTTAIGALCCYISDESVTRFQPMNINFGIMEPLAQRIKGKKFKNEALSARAIEEIKLISKELKR
jgi:methylenetetrahydrofolate--tRNA-(uracil-5-)-methyltransferase